jgi:glycerol-3-phosphate dehydrogenase
MLRDVDRLTGRTFDVLVVGGGVYGLTIAYDAAQRGLSVALIERDDFGSGASFNHLRTIHGGLRYLQNAALGRARESMRERRTLARIAPHAVEPLSFALPIYRSPLRGKTAMRLGFFADRIVSFGRNRAVPPALRLRGGRVVGRGDAVQRFPGLRRQGLTGAAVWWDYVTPESDRLTFAWALAAMENGATLVNHVEAAAPIVDGKRVTGVRAVDALSGHSIEIAARVTVNATGGAVDRLLAPIGLSSGMVFLKAMNLVTRRDAGDEALGGKSKSGRHLFLVPWRERALFGTWESPRACGSEDHSASEADVTSFIADLNYAFPSLDLTAADVTLVHRGIVPAAQHAGGRVSLQGHEFVRDHAEAQGEGRVDGLVSVAGTKYTTARAVAERVTDIIFRKMAREKVACRTAKAALPGGGARDVSLAIAEARREHDAGLPTDTIPHLIHAYGSRYRDVLDIADGRPELRSRLANDSPVIGAQLVWAARHEMAMTLADAVLRRTPLGALGHPGEPALTRAADIVGNELNWSSDQKQTEIAAVADFYRS